METLKSFIHKAGTFRECFCANDFHIKLAEWHRGSAAVRATRVRFQDSPQGDNPGQQLYHARAEQLGELGLPGCDEALSGMGGASLTNEVPGVM